MSFLRKLFGPRLTISPTPVEVGGGEGGGGGGAIDVAPLGLEFTHLPPAMDLSYHVMEGPKRPGMLIVSEAGRGLPFLGIWLEDAGGIWKTPEENQRLRASAPIRIPENAILTECVFNPAAVFMPLANSQTPHRVLLMRKRRATVFFILEDWLQAFVSPDPSTGQPDGFTVLVAVGGDGAKRALILPKWWASMFQDDWETEVRGGRPATEWEEANAVWEIHRPEVLRETLRALGAKSGDETILPPRSGGLEAVDELDRFLQPGESRRVRYFYTRV